MIKVPKSYALSSHGLNGHFVVINSELRLALKLAIWQPVQDITESSTSFCRTVIVFTKILKSKIDRMCRKENSLSRQNLR